MLCQRSSGEGSRELDSEKSNRKNLMQKPILHGLMEIALFEEYKQGAILAAKANKNLVKKVYHEI